MLWLRKLKSFSDMIEGHREGCMALIIFPMHWQGCLAVATDSCLSCGQEEQDYFHVILNNIEVY